MSVIKGPLEPGPDTEERRSDLVFIYGPMANSVCFYCGDELEYPLIHWHGFDHSIFLHHQCAARLQVHLASDYLKAEKAVRE